jgi:hypothetical protein
VIEVSEGRRIDFGPKRRRERGDPGLLRRRLLHKGVRRPRPPAPLRISRLGSQA